ncbi:MAG TPA: hypothetical protein VK348_10350 [Planctomycetota bacterium]|nr:hypothetical protein [Planctomycetota bacterium]
MQGGRGLVAFGGERGLLAHGLWQAIGIRHAAASQFHPRLVGEDRRQPRHQLSIGRERGRALDRPQEGLLDQVLRRRGVAGEPVGEQQQVGGSSVEHLGHGARAAATDQAPSDGVVARVRLARLEPHCLRSIPAPLTLAGFGMPGCDLLQSAEAAAQPVSSTGPGAATLSLPLPNIGALVGLQVYLQAWALAPGANPGNTVVSNGLDWFIGS